MSICMLTIFGLMPVGLLPHGQLAARAGEPAAVALSGLVMLGVAAQVYWRAAVAADAVGARAPKH